MEKRRGVGPRNTRKARKEDKGKGGSDISDFRVISCVGGLSLRSKRGRKLRDIFHLKLASRHESGGVTDMNAALATEISRLTPAEKLQLVEDLWDDLAAS